MSIDPKDVDEEKHGHRMSPRAATQLRDAMDRLLAGRPQRTDGRLIKDNLWKEDGLSRATINRADQILAEWNHRVAECDGFTGREARKTLKVQLCEPNSETRLANAPNSTAGSTQPLPPSPRCIMTACCYAKNSTHEGSSSRSPGIRACRAYPAVFQIRSSPRGLGDPDDIISAAAHRFGRPSPINPLRWLPTWPRRPAVRCR